MQRNAVMCAAPPHVTCMQVHPPMPPPAATSRESAASTRPTPSLALRGHRSLWGMSPSRASRSATRTPKSIVGPEAAANPAPPAGALRMLSYAAQTSCPRHASVKQHAMVHGAGHLRHAVNTCSVDGSGVFVGLGLIDCSPQEFQHGMLLLNQHHRTTTAQQSRSACLQSASGI